MTKKSKKAKKSKRTKKSKPRATMSVHELVAAVAKALSSEIGPDERKRITLRVVTAKQRKPAKRRKLQRR